MPKVHKTIEEAGKHLLDAIAVIGPRYKDATAKADWEGPSVTEEAEANYRAGLSESQAKDGRRVGIRAAGNAKFHKGTALKGAPIIGERIRAALDDYKREMSPILSAMNSAADAAPPRTRDFRANITNRLIPVVEAARRAAGKS